MLTLLYLITASLGIIVALSAYYTYEIYRALSIFDLRKTAITLIALSVISTLITCGALLIFRFVYMLPMGLLVSQYLITLIALYRIALIRRALMCNACDSRESKKK